MKSFQNLVVTMHTDTLEKLACLNEANCQINNPEEHHAWCSSGLPFGTKFDQFKPGDEPVVCWTARDENNALAGLIELHHNKFGWVLARLWVSPPWRRAGLGRRLHVIGLEYAFTKTDWVVCFRATHNRPSQLLQHSLGLAEVHEWPEEELQMLVVSRDNFQRAQLSGEYCKDKESSAELP